jgi:hypothetical protein
MTKNNTKIIAGIVGAVGIYFILKYYMDKKKTQPQAEDPATPSKPSDAPVLSSGDNFPLKKGSKGAKVIQVQSLLLKIDKKLLPKFGADGDFGRDTTPSKWPSDSAVRTETVGALPRRELDR